MLIFTKTKIESPESIEGENLAAHVILCRQREASTKARMDEIEERQDKLESRENDLRSYILKTITTAAFALLSSAVSLGMIISEFVKK
jgi:cell division protein FtsB